MEKGKWVVWVLILLLGLNSIAFSQDTPRFFEIKGAVLNNVGKPVNAANLQLTKEPGGALVKVEVAGADGGYIFQRIPAGSYRLVATHFDFAAYQSAVLNIQANTDLGNITLPERATTLKEVAVAARKPFIEQQFDKTVLNVENSITSSGSNALEVLEKAPGVNVDQNDNISMRGRSGVMVMIDGKRVPMSGQELANMLRGIPANSVDKIELITNPSAKYDAAGNAGIIDIRLKKDQRLGTNGNVSASFGQGKYSKIASGLQLNHREKKLNVFGNYNFTDRKEFVFLDIYRRFFEGETFTGAYDQENRFHTYVKSHNGRLGADYNISSKTIVGFALNGNLPVLGRERKSLNTSLVLDNRGQLQSYFLTSPHIRSERPNGALNFNLKHTIDSVGREISADIDFAKYSSSEVQEFTTDYYNLNNEKIRPSYLLAGDINGDLTIKSVKVDYSQPWAAIKGSLEAGFKSSLVEADNNLQFFDRSNGGNKIETNISNHFLYEENINAAYVNANKKLGKASFQLGLRLENTQADGLQVTDGKEFDRNYTQLFPSGFVGYKYSEQHDLGLSLSRRIDRPTYNQLNPYKNFLDPSTYSAGNPFLKPELTYSFELTHTFKQKIVSKFSYSHTDDVIINVLSPDPNQEKVVIQTNLNLAQLDYYGLTLTVPANIGNWFSSVNNGTFYYGLYRGNLANTNLNNGRPTFNLNSNNTITLGKTWTAEVIGVYRAREIYGFLDVQPISFLSEGVQKQLWNKRGSLKLNLTDAFYSNKTRATTVLTGYAEDFYQRRDTRVATLAFTYRFGKNQVAPARKRTGGAEEEKRRAG